MHFPFSRYALICSHCYCHNGLALAEQFEYLPFRCGFCFTFNPARKQQRMMPSSSTAPTPSAAIADDDNNVIETPSSLSRRDSTGSENDVVDRLSHSTSDNAIASSTIESITNDYCNSVNDESVHVQDPVPSGSDKQ